MKKKHLDYLYEKLFELQQKIDKLVEERNQPKASECAGCGCPLESELEATRKAIQIVNLIIENYIALHPATLM